MKIAIVCGNLGTSHVNQMVYVFYIDVTLPVVLSIMQIVLRKSKKKTIF